MLDAETLAAQSQLEQLVMFSVDHVPGKIQVMECLSFPL